MRAILGANAMRAERIEYAVPGWGEGELWTMGATVLSHDFDFLGEWGDYAPSDASNASPDRRSRALVERFTAFLHGDDVAFDDVPLDLSYATPFQRAVTSVLRAVPRGEVVSYGELAALAGYPGAQRAVGTFCARNRFMFIVPCHRVVAADGIGSYGSAGVAVKRRLLELEGVLL